MGHPDITTEIRPSGSPLPAPESHSFEPRHFVSQFYDLLGDHYQSRLGPAVFAELEALSKEKDPDLFWAGAIHLAGRLERDNRIEESLALLESISAELGGGFLELERAVDRSAKVLQGQGQFGDRFEFMLRRVSHELDDPWAIAAFGAGSLAFRATKMATMARLWSGSARAYLPGRAAANFIAAGSGLGAEAPVFLLTSKLGRQIGGKPQDWSARTVGQELAGVGLTLAILKGTGALGQEAAFRLGGGVALKGAVPQVAMLSGILLAQRAEERLGLKPASSSATFLADGLATYLHFVAAGRLADGVLGARFHSLQRRFDWQTTTMPPSVRWFPASPAMATAIGPAVRPVEVSVIYELGRPLYMESMGDGGSGSRKGPRAPGGPKSKEEEGAAEQQVVDLSAFRVLRSRPMDNDKEARFKAEVENVMLGSASNIRRQTLEQEVIAKLPAPRREELRKNLQGLHPELVDLFGSAARDLPLQAMAEAFVEMKLMRSSPGEMRPLPPSGEVTPYSREVLAEELRLDHRRLFDAPLPGAPEALNAAMGRLSEASIQLLGHYTQGPGTRLLMGQRLSLPGLPAESKILEAYQKWLDRPPESK
ncbi:MAG TPA: hypothetical protein VJR29_14795 [bacterium]|nr:hypothetical protein [bacterium]